jgi:hypothetical protein
MQTSLDRNTLILIGIFAIFLASPVAAEWNINVLDQPYSFQNVSNASNTVQIVELTDGDGTPINESQLAGDSYFDYVYDGERVEDGMKWLSDGYWYAEFELNNTGGQIDYEAEGTTESSLIGDSTTEVEGNRTFNPGNMSVNLMNDFSQRINPEIEYDIKVNVTDNADVFEDQADVDFYFTNGTWTSEMYNINNYADDNDDGQNDHYKNFGLRFDLKFNSTYVLHINATNTTDVGYNNSYGVQSMEVNTLPEIKGSIAELNTSSGCNSESFFSECESNTTIDTAFNVTQATAENVNLSLELKNSTSGEWINNSTVKLEAEEDLYRGSIEVPDINTSAYDKEFRLKYNASNGDREEIINRIVDYNDFRIEDKSDTITAKGLYRVKLEIRKYFTPRLLERSRIMDGDVTISQPSGEELDSFEIEDMDRLDNRGHYERDVSIPVDAETGVYEMDVSVSNVYNETKVESYNFEVTNVQQTFTVNDGDDFERTINKKGNQSFNITVENTVNTETNVSEELEGWTEVNDGENISLNPEESRNVSLRFDIPSVDEYDGEIEFSDNDASYNKTMDVEFNKPSCSYRNSTICVLGSNFNVSSQESGNTTNEFTLINFGEVDQEYSYSIDLSGNITSYASLGTENLDLNTENDTQEANMTYEFATPGFYSGTLEIDNEEDILEIPVALDSNVEPTSTSMGLPDEVNLGDVQEGDTVSADIDVENTGDIEITGTELSSDDYSVSAGSISIASGETETLSVEFSEVETESGELTVTAETESESVSDTISVSSTVVPDYEAQADELEQRLIDLDSQVSSDSEYQTELNNAQSSISDLRSAYRQGDYERAETLNSQISNTLDNVEMEMQSAPSQPENPNQSNQPDQSGGGLPILPIALVIFVLLVLGFVAYTSIEFERGDPLYNVLGK